MTGTEASENHTTIADLGRDEVRAAAAEVGLRLNDADCDAYLAALAGNVNAYRAVAAMNAPALDTREADRS